MSRTDWTLRLAGHRPLDSEDEAFDDDYLWTCECGSMGEDIATRDAHILSMLSKSGWAPIPEPACRNSLMAILETIPESELRVLDGNR